MHQDAMDESWNELVVRIGLADAPARDPLWSAGADFLALAVDAMLRTRPAVVVECGSGASTVVLAQVLKRGGWGGRLHGLDHAPEFAAATRAELARFGLGDEARVLDAPLTGHALAGAVYPWYSLDGLPDRIDFLVIDGPPGRIGRHARYPALPLLAGRLSAGAPILLDDAARPDEREVIARWQAEFPGLSVEQMECERGCVVLHWRGKAGRVVA